MLVWTSFLFSRNFGSLAKELTQSDISKMLPHVKLQYPLSTWQILSKRSFEISKLIESINKHLERAGSGFERFIVVYSRPQNICQGTGC
jgi:hypothetical protein